MERALVTTKGQIVIPAKLRRKFGIRKGTQVFVYEKDGEIVVELNRSAVVCPSVVPF